MRLPTLPLIEINVLVFPRGKSSANKNTRLAPREIFLRDFAANALRKLACKLYLRYVIVTRTTSRDVSASIREHAVDSLISQRKEASDPPYLVRHIHDQVLIALLGIALLKISRRTTREIVITRSLHASDRPIDRSAGLPVYVPTGHLLHRRNF
jgi:hypothetical protein